MNDVLVAVLAGGRGERLQPLTNTCPKPLLQWKGLCGVQHAFCKAHHADVERVAIVGHHDFETIKRAIGNMMHIPSYLEVLKEDRPCDTGGCLHTVMHLEFRTLVVLYTDIFFETSLMSVLGDHHQQNAAITLGVSLEEVEVPYGVVNCNGNEVLEFREKKHRISVFAGVAVISRELLDRIEWGTPFGFDALVRRALQEQLHVCSSEVSGWTHLTPELLPELVPVKVSL